jgi:predicted metal-dependent TIM-barrel fold hydrolase
MATINITNEGNLLIATVTGVLTAEEVMAVIKEYYPNRIVKNVIWDLTHCSLISIPKTDLQIIAKVSKESVARGARAGGKTAFVVNSTVDYGLMRMYSSIAEATYVPVEYSMYRTIEEARIWLEQDS